jgi:hypothetical protein
VFADDRFERLGRNVLDGTSPNPPATLNKSDNRRLSLRGAAPLANPTLSANIGFIDLDRSTKRGLQRHRSHGKPDAMSKMPRRLVGLEPKIPLQLECRDTFLVAAHRMERLNPLAKRNVRAVHHGADRDGELLAAGVALEQPIADLLGFGIDPRGVPASAVWTHRTVGPTDVFKNRSRFVFCESGHVNRGHVFQVRKLRWSVSHWKPPFLSPYSIGQGECFVK